MNGPKTAKTKRMAQWALWGAVSISAAVGLGSKMTNKNESSRVFLPGKTTDGHYQMELSCASCHTQDFTSAQDFQAACIKCHAAELEEAQDSHPETKFTDPRNAERVALLDASKCVTCHSEHQPARTGSMGLSLPRDYCYQCHQEVGQERPSHLGLPYDSCADVGCHNFHDNRAIYEDYLVKRAAEPPVLGLALRPLGRSGDCPSPKRAQSNDAAAVEECKSCHDTETASWLGGRHGMRLSVGLPAMKPGEARLPMKAAARERELSCGACHGGDPKSSTPQASRAAMWVQVEACLSCHDDEHSRAYKSSKHFELFTRELEQKVAVGAGVTCATCHLPRSKDDDGKWRVNHNQNHNLRPVEKQVRTACASCHGLRFSIDALADPRLLLNNFSGPPSVHVASVDWAVARN